MNRIFTFLTLFLAISTQAQLTSIGVPSSNKNEVNPRIPVIEITPPNRENINEASKQKNIASLLIKTNIDFINQAQLTILKNGDRVYRLLIRSKNAKAINIYYDAFKIPLGAKFYVYSPNKSEVLGAYTSLNNSKKNLFTHDYISDDKIIIEYNEPNNSKSANINISQVGYFIRDLEKPESSADCEVNINCSEGDDWQDEKKGVVRLLIKVGSQTFWCSGSLINNTDTDCTPYILSAEHCTNGSSNSDNNASIVYFNFESNSCSGSTADASSTMIGFDIIASGPASGSDFILMKLKNSIPDSYNPYYNGWKKDDAIFNSGVSIHHPSSDIKKISTYTTALTTTSISGGMINAYWGVTWSSTSNGHGITEGGSSGSPLFNANGLIVGTLTGGTSFCNTPSETDFYGKISAHWSLNGNNSNQRLSDWLDPSGLGVTELKGTYKPCTNSTNERELDGVKVWPNPALSILNISIEHSIQIKPTILIHNLLGKVILKKELQKNNEFSEVISINRLTPGNYILSITTTTISHHQSIIIAR